MGQRTLIASVAILVAVPAAAADLTFKKPLVENLIKQVPAILKTYHAESGRFGSGIFICSDQNQMYPLAVAYATPAGDNRYHKDAKLLQIIMQAGDALIDDADERGQWVFRKKDGSTWGKIWMPWTYSRWVRTFALIRDDMPVERRKTWADALTLGYTGISRHCLGHVHNIPTHHAMGLYAAGKLFDRPEWRKQAADFMIRVIGAQSEGGYWSENLPGSHPPEGRPHAGIPNRNHGRVQVAGGRAPDVDSAPKPAAGNRCRTGNHAG